MGLYEKSLVRATSFSQNQIATHNASSRRRIISLALGLLSVLTNIRPSPANPNPSTKTSTSSPMCRSARRTHPTHDHLPIHLLHVNQTALVIPIFPCKKSSISDLMSNACRIRDFHVTEDPTEIGYYAGLITTMFSLAQVISSIPIGMLSDRVGRRPVLLLGLAGNVVSACLFGLARNFAWAVVARAMLGFVNGELHRFDSGFLLFPTQLLPGGGAGEKGKRMVRLILSV